MSFDYLGEFYRKNRSFFQIIEKASRISAMPSAVDLAMQSNLGSFITEPAYLKIYRKSLAPLGQSPFTKAMADMAIKGYVTNENSLNRAMDLMRDATLRKSAYESASLHLQNSILNNAVNNLVSNRIFQHFNIDKDILNVAILKRIHFDVDIENSASRTETETSIADALDEANVLLNTVTNDSVQLYKVFTSTLRKLYDSEKIKNLTQDFVFTLIINILMAWMGLNGDEQNFEINMTSNIEFSYDEINNVDNRTIQNFDNSQTINNFYNELCFAKANTTLFTRRDIRSRIICVIPEGTEMDIIKKYRNWAVVVFIDQDQTWKSGYIRTENIEW